MKKSVVLIANSGFTIVNFRSELIQLLSDNGFDVYVMCPTNCKLMGQRDLTTELSVLGSKFVPIELSRSGLNPFNELKSALSIYKNLRSLKPDLVLNYTIKPVIYGSIASKFAQIDKVASNITGVGYVFTSDKSLSKLIAKLIKFQYKLALKNNEKVFFQNPDDRAFFVDEGLVSADKSVLINGSGVDVNKFKRLKKISNKPSFIFVGRLLKDKGIYEYFEAARILKEKYPCIVFAVLGDLDDNPSSMSKKKLERYISEEIITYHGTSNNVREYLEGYSVMVLPSYREGTPRSVLEAMSMSMPIVTSDAPGCKETVINHINGFTVSVGDAESLARAMEEFIFRPELIEQFGWQSRRLACDKYCVHIVNNSILNELL